MSERPPNPNPSALHFRIHSRTDVGKRRQRNEDSLGVIARHGVFLVADGMGGVDGGDFSSRQVIIQMTRNFQKRKVAGLTFCEVVNLAEQSIVQASGIIKKEAEVRGISGMGTTVVVLCFDMKHPERACVLHVGDSRLYRFRNRELAALTRDHSLAEESGIQDKEMIPMFMAGVITRAVGVREDVQVDRAELEVKHGDLFLLCSDGLYNMVPEEKMSEILSLNSVDPAADLVNQANEAGGFDNITVVLVEARDRRSRDAGLEDTVS